MNELKWSKYPGIFWSTVGIRRENYILLLEQGSVSDMDVLDEISAMNALKRKLQAANLLWWWKHYKQE